MLTVRHRIPVVVALVLGAVLWAGTPAAAEDPVDFGSSPVVDTVGALGDRVDEVEQAIDQAADRSGRQLFVAYVSEFTNPERADQWAADTAISNNMGTEDYLLAVAVDGRAYFLSRDDNASLSAGEIERISQDVIEPHLRDEDWAGAAIAAADAIGGGAGGGFPWGLVWFLLIAAAIVVVVVIVLARRRKRGGSGGGGAGTGAPPVSIEELRRQAGSALVAVDDALRTSEDELGFAVASYGDEATEPFRAALAEAKAKVAEAFTLQQKLDDADPDTDEQRREWYGRIIALAGEADALLDEQADRFDDLRGLEQNAPAELERVRGLAAQQQAALPAIGERLTALGAVYAASALSTVADNPAQAAARVSFALAAVDRAGASLDAGETGPAAVAIRGAEEAVDQAKLLAEAVDRLGADLEQADQAIAAGVADLDADVRTARSLDAANLGSIADATQAEASALGAALAQPGRDPLALGARLKQANDAIDQAIGAARDAAERAARAAAELDRALLSARSQVDAAESYLTARRGAVGPEARTRLAEAARLAALAEQQRAADPAAALQSARRAEQLAAEASRLAQQDVGGFDAGFGGGAQGRSSGGGDMLGAVLGGIVINSVLGGGGGGFGGLGGGGSRRSSGGGFGGFGGGRSTGGFGGGRSTGSFGGSSTRGRRSGGSGGRF
ncbi:TPM domain-containing protein [Agromyces larvae]|uniref:TPM domain-containing protein n=1 Tax=Agromyces larvae TaxID=2929802 RepID=UPI0025B70FEC|nr:TPM domain-containing protein [Agromyces larvae]